jgi:hypothetical protein
MSQPIAPGIVNVLAQTRPWVRLTGVVALLLAALAEVRILLKAVEDRGRLETNAAGYLVVVGLMMLPPLLYVPAGLYLRRYSTSIRLVQDGGGPAALEAALAHQKNFWKYVGVMLLIACIALTILPLGAILIGISGARR